MARTWNDPNKPRIAPGVLRSLSEDIYTPYGWRRGPDTPDGYWMVSTKQWTDGAIQAVRVVIAPDGKDYRLLASPKTSAYDDLTFAVQKHSLDAQDAYLLAVQVVADMAADPLMILKQAVKLGRKGGELDGDPGTPAKPVRRSRKAVSA